MPESSNPWEQLPELYDRLLVFARQELAKERDDHTWRPSDLTQETLVKLMASERVEELLQNEPEDWERQVDRYALTVMDRLLINHAREKRALKRGGGIKRDHGYALEELEFDDSQIDLETFEALHLLLERLRERSSRQAKFLKLRWYTGMSVSEIAHIHHVSESTVRQELRVAVAWLNKEAAKVGLSPIKF